MLGNVHPLLLALQAEAKPSLTFLDPKWHTHAQWRAVAANTLLDRLLYSPPPCELDRKVPAHAARL